ncbi:hypothetical protein [Dyadobacter luticola]|uniref:Outer membrane protein beta-barrel domain-containing protein n=1 Tax=Dyadobacter luticola TaxID=1979387 RepID=A0A5R9L621_9BACT|nr:hypothetical protein [Dyadobacter luticola]TLV03730.1 hypothetical protein FEN17_09060 [Dyadobacter luticola]
MKNWFPLLLSMLILPAAAQAQWTRQIGINVVPLIARTLEVNSEFSDHPGYGLTLSAGHTFRTPHTGLINYDVYDGIDDRKTSGTFVKAGIKLNLNSITGTVQRTNFYIGTALILSQYRQTAMKRELDDVDRVTFPVSTSGVTLCPAVSMGFTTKIGKHLIFDWGVQKAFVYREDDFIGTRARNYQPGAGAEQATPFVSYVQGMLSLRYRF